MSERRRVPRSERWREPAYGRPRRRRFLGGRLLIFLLCVLVVGAGVWWLSGSRRAITANVTEMGLRNIGEMATQAGYFTSVQTIEKSRDVFGIEVPGTRSSYVYSYDGDIKAGLDFSDVEIQVNELTRVITVRLPEIRILSVEIQEDSFVLYNDGSNLFTALKLEDVNRSNAEMIRVTKETAIKNGILESARDNAEVLIRGFLSTAYDMNVYTIEYHYTDNTGE